MANKADKAASRGEIPVYRSWCPGAGESEQNALELAALDPPTAARVHAERMTDLAWKVAIKSPDDVCVSCGQRRAVHHMRHIFKADRDARSVTILVRSPDGRMDSFVVRRRMQPVFEVVT